MLSHYRWNLRMGLKQKSASKEIVGKIIDWSKRCQSCRRSSKNIGLASKNGEVGEFSVEN
jgi:hypothetical protein